MPAPKGGIADRLDVLLGQKRCEILQTFLAPTLRREERQCCLAGKLTPSVTAQPVQTPCRPALPGLHAAAYRRKFSGAKRALACPSLPMVLTVLDSSSAGAGSQRRNVIMSVGEGSGRPGAGWRRCSTLRSLVVAVPALTARPSRSLEPARQPQTPQRREQRRQLPGPPGRPDPRQRS